MVFEAGSDTESVDRLALLTPHNHDAHSLLLNGEQALHTDGNLHTARAWFNTAYQTAEHNNDPTTMARAALGSAGLWIQEHHDTTTNAQLQQRLHHTLTKIDPKTTLALRLRARITAETDYRNTETTNILTILDEAHHTGNPTAWNETLSLAQHCLLGPHHTTTRHPLAQKMVITTTWSPRPSDHLISLLWRTIDQFLTANHNAEHHLNELTHQLTQQPHQAITYTTQAIQTMLLIRNGQLTHAEHHATTNQQHGHTTGHPNTTNWHHTQLTTIRWYQGRITELLPTLTQTANSPHQTNTDNTTTAHLALAAATAGNHQQATTTLAQLTTHNLTKLPRSEHWLTTMYAIVETAHLLGDTTTATTAYHLLTPHAHQPTIAPHAISCYGSTHHTLGMAMLTTGNTNQAIHHFQTALQHNTTINHQPATTLTHLRLAQTLTQQATKIAVPLPSAAGWLSVVGSGQAITTVDRPRVICIRYGRLWRIEVGRRTAIVEHGLGMLYLNTLIANPGQEIGPIMLAAGSGLPSTAAAESAVSSDQPILDVAAKRRYQRRLSQLSAEIEKLESTNHPERATKAQAERDWLLSQLTTATSMSGRVRRFTDNEERARIAVGRAIRRALTQIESADPTIGEELRATIHTGTRCFYQPR